MSNAVWRLATLSPALNTEIRAVFFCGVGMHCVHQLQVELEITTPFITTKFNPQLTVRDSSIVIYKTTGRPKVCSLFIS